MFTEIKNFYHFCCITVSEYVTIYIQIFIMYIVSSQISPGDKAAWVCLDHPSPSSAEFEGRIELHICSPSGPSWPVLGWTLPLPFTSQVMYFVSFIKSTCRTQASAHYIRGRHSNSGMGSTLSTSIFSCQYHPANAPYSSIHSLLILYKQQLKWPASTVHLLYHVPNTMNSLLHSLSINRGF